MDTVTVLTNAPVSCVLAGNDIRNGYLFGQRQDPMLPQKIYATYIVIKKIYDNDTQNQYVTLIYAACQYLWELMSKYGIQAQGFTGGGSVAPITPIGSFEYLIPISGSDFADSTHYNDTRIIGKSLKIFWNDIQRFLYNTEFNNTTTGINITAVGFDAVANPTYQLDIFIINP